MRLLRLTIASLWLAVTLTASVELGSCYVASATATECPADAACLTAADLEEVIRQECADGIARAVTSAEAQRDAEHGARVRAEAELERARRERDAAVLAAASTDWLPGWARVAMGTGAGGAMVGAGWCGLSDECPMSTALVLLGAGLVVELLALVL